jgi:peptidoglycan/xylan/chitin deacetylase (PgdA/CDA1 family)
MVAYIAMNTRVPILTYHRVHLDDQVTVPNDPGRVNLSEFKKQMQHLAKLGMQTVTHRQIAGWLLDDEAILDNAIAIDFDDNRQNVFDNAWPIMRELGFVGTVFTITDLADKTPLPGMEMYPAMDWQTLNELRDGGWCIAPHTCTHTFLTQTDLDSARHEMQQSYDRVCEMTGIDAPYFAYPSGCWNQALEDIAKTIFKTTLHWCTSTDPRIEVPPRYARNRLLPPHGRQCCVGHDLRSL